MSDQLFVGIVRVRITDLFHDVALEQNAQRLALVGRLLLRVDAELVGFLHDAAIRVEVFLAIRLVVDLVRLAEAVGDVLLRGHSRADLRDVLPLDVASGELMTLRDLAAHEQYRCRNARKHRSRNHSLHVDLRSPILQYGPSTRRRPQCLRTTRRSIRGSFRRRRLV
jgi:hypothetical protein